MRTRILLFIFIILIQSIVTQAQNRCSAVEVLERQFKANPASKLQFDLRQQYFNSEMNRKKTQSRSSELNDIVTIPVVFHVVLRNHALATDAQILAQLDTINKDFAGANAGRFNVPNHFKDLFGESKIRFTNAKRTPDGQTTNGIVRYNTSINSFSSNNEFVKHSQNGGADSWNTDNYLNIWICDLGNVDLGYGTFPGQSLKEDEGVVIHYLSLPKSSNPLFHGGKTLTHEIGHYFNLFHIWGDDLGACSGSDEVEDTPNQGDFTKTVGAVVNGIYPDFCADGNNPNGKGRMYQNFMDYTPDDYLWMFTKGQVSRLEFAFERYRSSLRNSMGGIPISLTNHDAGIRTITSPQSRLCADNFTPRVILKNYGVQPLTSVKIFAVLENGDTIEKNWNGNLASLAETEVELSQMRIPEGNLILSIYTSLPNGIQDEEVGNDESSKTLHYFLPIATDYIQTFEEELSGIRWSTNISNGTYNWEKTSLASFSGRNSIRIRNYENTVVGLKSELLSPDFKVAEVDSAFVTFQLAASNVNSIRQNQNGWDTLEVFISTDCGLTRRSIYKKWGDALSTTTNSSRAEFIPNKNEWRKEKINITQFVPSEKFLIILSNTSGNQNDIYIDDFEVQTVVVNPNLKKEGFLVSPNPTEDIVRVQFYPHPNELSSIAIYNVNGQAVKKLSFVAGIVPSNQYEFDLSAYPTGIYIVKAVLGGKVLTKKVVVK